MDDAETRAARTRELYAAIDELAKRGGDANTVLLGMAERLLLGVDRYGPLNLDDGHDWGAEEDEERADIVNYQAIRRAVERRGLVTRSAARRTGDARELARVAAAKRRVMGDEERGRVELAEAEEKIADIDTQAPVPRQREVIASEGGRGNAGLMLEELK